MISNREYITWIDPKKGRNKTFIDVLLKQDQNETGGANTAHIEGLLPHEQYAIFRANCTPLSVDEAYDAYVEDAKQAGVEAAPLSVFIKSVLKTHRRKAELVRVGSKHFFIGIRMIENKDAPAPV